MDPNTDPSIASNAAETARGRVVEREAPTSLPPAKRAWVKLGGLAHALGKTTLTIALLLLVAFMVVWYVTPYVLRDYLNKKGEGLPDYNLHIDWVQINPLPCSLDIEGVTLVKKSDKIPVPFFTCPQVHVAMQWRTLIHFNLRSWIALTSPVVNFVNGPTEDTTQTALEPAWVTQVKKMVPLRINRFTIYNGTIHYYDFHADPQINMVLDQLNLSLDNLTNSNHSKELMPSTAFMTGRPFGIGVLEVRLALNVDLKQPTFAEKVKLEKIPAPALNSFLAKYGSVYAKSGNLAFYTEMVSAKGAFNGYMKPFFQNLEFEPVPKDRHGLGSLWASIVNGMKDLLENDQHAVATDVPIKGTYADPNIDFWSAAFGLIRNAYLQALAHGFDNPELAPAPEKQDISQHAVDKAVDENMQATPDKDVDLHQTAAGPKGH